MTEEVMPATDEEIRDFVCGVWVTEQCMHCGSDTECIATCPTQVYPRIQARIEQDRRRLEAAEKLADASESLLREYGYREPIADAAYVLQKALNEWEAAK